MQISLYKIINIILNKNNNKNIKYKYFYKQELFDIAEMLSKFLAGVLCTVASI